MREEERMKEREEDEIIRKIKAKAKLGATSMLTEICRQCKLKDKDCKDCPYSEAEKLIRAFLE
jgi:hypothetical protein